MGGQLGPIAGLNIEEKMKYGSHVGDRTTIVQIVVSYYTDCRSILKIMELAEDRPGEVVSCLGNFTLYTAISIKILNMLPHYTS
jgi:hypothetical protein